MKFSFKLRVNFFGKHTIFVGPIGWLLRKMGGIPVNRSAAHNIVEQIVNTFEQNDSLIFALSPEGTRGYRDHWKSGFYHIALNAKVPVQICFLDMKKREVGFGPLIELSGNEQEDLQQLIAFFQDKQGVRPECFSRIAFRKSD